MCIIWIKNKGLDLPTKETIQTMCENNPHGNGFCYAENGEVVIKKGYMDFQSYYEALLSIPNIKGINLIGHCRITTHGSTSKENCHPFPLSNRIKDLKATNLKTKVGVIHNGIINIEAEAKHDLSDTMTYIKNKLYNKYLKNENFMDNQSTRTQIQKEITSKMVIVKGNGDYQIIGEFNTDDKGYIFSNNSYKPYEYKKWSYSSFWGDVKGIKEVDSEDKFTIDDIIINGLTLDYDDFILLEGVRVYGEEMDMYLMPSGEVYVDNFDDGFMKVANIAFDRGGSIIKYNKRYEQEIIRAF